MEKRKRQKAGGTCKPTPERPNLRRKIIERTSFTSFTSTPVKAWIKESNAMAPAHQDKRGEGSA
jgi:hypothetical protein